MRYEQIGKYSIAPILDWWQFLVEIFGGNIWWKYLVEIGELGWWLGKGQL